MSAKAATVQLQSPPSWGRWAAAQRGRHRAIRCKTYCEQDTANVADVEKGKKNVAKVGDKHPLCPAGHLPHKGEIGRHDPRASRA